MKAYVIKNKEGKYFSVADNYNYEHYWTTLDFAHYFRYLEGHDAKAEAEDYRNTRYPDCQVVETTIAEGDLEQQLAIYKQALELACIDVGTITIITKILKDNQVRATLKDVINYYLNQAKKELEGDNNRILSIHADDFNKILDQIEKGE